MRAGDPPTYFSSLALSDTQFSSFSDTLWRKVNPQPLPLHPWSPPVLSNLKSIFFLSCFYDFLWVCVCECVCVCALMLHTQIHLAVLPSRGGDRATGFWYWPCMLSHLPEVFSLSWNTIWNFRATCQKHKRIFFFFANPFFLRGLRVEPSLLLTTKYEAAGAIVRDGDRMWTRRIWTDADAIFWSLIWNLCRSHFPMK